MSECFEKTCTRMGENSETIKCWAEGEAVLGLRNSMFICEDGIATQYVSKEEGEDFYNLVENMDEEQFNNICNDFLKAIKEKDLTKMHVGLTVFDEMDEHDLGTDEMKKKLMKIRESTHEESYKFKLKGIKDFIYYKGRIYK